MYYDIHCHVFNKAIISKRLDVILAPLFKLIDAYENKLSDQSIAEIIDKADAFLDAFKKETTEELFNEIDSTYAHEFTLTPLMMDLEYTDDEDFGVLGEIKHRIWKEVASKFIHVLQNQVNAMAERHPQIAERIGNLNEQLAINGEIDQTNWADSLTSSSEVYDSKNFEQQIYDLEHLASKYQRVRPFLGLDARRSEKQDLVQLIRDKIVSPQALFAGIKLYAPTGFSPTHPALYGWKSQRGGVYAFCEDHGIPITVHCSNVGFTTHANSIKIDGLVNLNNQLTQKEGKIIEFGIPFFSLRLPKAIKERARTLNHPKIWTKVFEKYPNLKLNLAHFGGKDEMMRYTHYQIETEKLTSNEFEELIDLANSDEYKAILNRAFLKHEMKVKNTTLRTTYVFDQTIDDEDRKKLWNLLYHIGWIDNWSKAILDILFQYPNAYSDVSCFSSGKMVDGEFSIKENLMAFKEKVYDTLPDEVKNKILYGSDFFFVLMFGPTMKNYVAEFKSVFGAEFDRIASRNPEQFLKIDPIKTLTYI